jgi:hypothetical protein
MFVDEINVDIKNNLKELFFCGLSYFKVSFIIKKIIQQKCVKILNRDVENDHNYHRLF